MLILALDSSTTSGSVALVEDGSTVLERSSPDVGTHADWLMPNIARLFEEASKSPKDVDLVAVTRGPGSFTGLRVGISTVKGLAWSVGAPVAGVSTLEALAMNFNFSTTPVCTMLDARKREVYASLYRFEDGRAVELLPEAAVPPETLLERVGELVPDPGVLFAGSGLRPYGQLVKEMLPGAIFTPEPQWHIRASNVARLAALSEPRDPAGFVPRYLRRSEAEIKAAKG